LLRGEKKEFRSKKLPGLIKSMNVTQREKIPQGGRNTPREGCQTASAGRQGITKRAKRNGGRREPRG